MAPRRGRGAGLLQRPRRGCYEAAKTGMPVTDTPLDLAAIARLPHTVRTIFTDGEPVQVIRQVTMSEEQRDALVARIRELMRYHDTARWQAEEKVEELEAERERLDADLVHSEKMREKHEAEVRQLQER